MNSDVAVSFVDVVKTYQGADHNALDHLNLEIKQGEIFGILGPNGAGKTTSLSLISGILEPSSGSIEVFGQGMGRGNTQLLKKLGYVPQDIALYPTLTGKENLEYFASMYGLSKGESQDKIGTYMNKFGLEKAANKRLENYSGGMKRRVNLIAGILHDPEILILDEPTVGIDVQSKNVIIEFLVELNRSGTSILYTSHHLDEAQDFCSRIAIIDQGKSIALGSPNELIDKYEKVDDLQDLFLELTGKSLRD